MTAYSAVFSLWRLILKRAPEKSDKTDLMDEQNANLYSKRIKLADIKQRIRLKSHAESFNLMAQSGAQVKLDTN